MSKYRAIKTIVDNVLFDSKAEAARYNELKLLLKAGEISNLVIHPPYKLFVNNKLICKYVADFSYYDRFAKLIVEDVKGVKTPVYNLKKKFMLAVHGITINEITKKPSKLLRAKKAS